MIPAKALARQLQNPSGPIGRFLLPRVWNRRNAALNDVTLQSLDLRSDDRVLDVGCGGGYLIGRIAQKVNIGWIAGVDRSQSMTDFCSRRLRRWIQDGRVEIRCCPAEALPYPDGCFSKVCTVNTIFYIEDLEKALSELRRVLDEGGTLAVCFTDWEWMASKPFAAHGLRLYEAEEVEQLMESSGFHDMRMIRGRDRWREFVCVSGKK
jgi:ubiquinone/menaquinone biosynthesis C-methylase UbiE